MFSLRFSVSLSLSLSVFFSRFVSFVSFCFDLFCLAASRFVSLCLVLSLSTILQKLKVRGGDRESETHKERKQRMRNDCSLVLLLTGVERDESKRITRWATKKLGAQVCRKYNTNVTHVIVNVFAGTQIRSGTTLKFLFGLVGGATMVRPGRGDGGCGGTRDRMLQKPSHQNMRIHTGTLWHFEHSHRVAH